VLEKSRWVVKAFRKKFLPKKEVFVNRSSDLVKLAHQIDKPVFRMVVPTTFLRMQGAFQFNKDHPFVHALDKGTSSLRTFYGGCQPSNLFDFYGMSSASDVSLLQPWEIPWYQRHQRKPPPGEGNLGPLHGVSYFGPVTEEKIKFEMQRLENVANSITKYGYDPDAFGDIEGYILRKGDKVCFFVRGGKHRSAALAYLGFDKIPIAFRQGFPRVVDNSQAEYWPLVADGKIGINNARQILDVYFTGRSRKDFVNE
tara:strand:- start:119 stop:883 length:765 start_codon:yes stop_codon:yes gene_type:complete